MLYIIRKGGQFYTITHVMLYVICKGGQFYNITHVSGEGIFQLYFSILSGDIWNCWLSTTYKVEITKWNIGIYPH